MQLFQICSRTVVRASHCTRVLGRQFSSNSKYDALIIGGGHNGLTCAAYLAKAGCKVCVLESRPVVGGAAITEEFHPGFRNSSASYAVSLLSPKVIADLDLHKEGLRIVERPMGHFLPLNDKQCFMTGSSENESMTREQIHKFSAKDAQNWPKYTAMLDRIVDALREIIDLTPPNIGSTNSFVDYVNAMKTAGLLRSMSLPEQRDLVDMFTKSAGEILDAWFESDPVKGLLGFDAVTGNFQSPYAPGSAYVLLHHVFGEINGKKGVWGHAIGGMGAITQAMARTCEKRGVHIRVNASVKQVLVENGRAVGVRLSDGSVIKASVLASSVHPKTLYLSLIDTQHLHHDFVRRIRNYRSKSGTFRMNVALRELPDFTCFPGKQPAPHHASVMFSPSLHYLDRAWLDAREFGWSKQPAIEMHIPSTFDTTLAPTGQHVASLFCQHFDYQLPDGLSWDTVKEKAANDIIAHVTKFAPNFAEAVIAKQIHSPLDLERKFGLIGGDIFHGSLSLDQLFSARPVIGHGSYRGPLAGLYHCGSGAHPGGGVTGRPGRNASREILADLSSSGFVRALISR